MSLYDHSMFKHVAIVPTYEVVLLSVPRQGLLSIWFACKAHFYLNSQVAELLDPSYFKKAVTTVAIGSCMPYVSSIL